MAIRKAPPPSASVRPTRVGDVAQQRPPVDQARGLEKAKQTTTKPAVAPVSDGAASVHLAEGMAREKAEVGRETAAATQQQMEALRIDGLTGKAVSKREFTPAFQAAKEVGRALVDANAAALEDKAPEWQAAVSAIAPEVSGMVQKTVGELAKDPAALARVKNVVGKLGAEGFQQAVKDAAPDVARAFTAATGVEMVNKPVVEAGLKALASTAEKVAPEIAADVAKRCADVGVKLGVTAGKEVAEGAAKAVATTVAKTAGKEVAEGAAKASLKTAAAAGKAVPAVGNVIAVGSTCLAAVSFVKEIAKKPVSAERVAKEGVNTLLQAVGIAFPWAALGGDLLDLGWSAKVAVQDAKQGKPEAPERSLQLSEAAGLVDGPARALASALEGAGQGGTAQAFRELSSAAKDVASSDASPTARAQLRKKQLSAFESLAKTSAAETSTLAAQQPAGANKDALESLSHGFGQLFQALYQAKKLGPDDEAKRGDVKAKLLSVLAEVAKASAALAVGA